MDSELKFQAAVDTANAALARIDTHEAVCLEQNKAVQERLKDHEDNINLVIKILIATGGGVITTLLAAVGTLAMMVFKH